MKTTKLLLSVTLIAGVVLTCLSFGPGSQAVAKGKPGGGPPPDGQIYFETYVAELEESRLAVMNADGTGKTLLPAAVPPNSQPSYRIHDGQRWHLAFTETPGDFHPDGQPRGILEAVWEDGSARVTLVDDPTMYLNWDYFWSKDDAWISVAGLRWDLSVEPPQIVEAGLYLMPVGFDADGPFALAPLALTVESDVQGDVQYGPAIRRHDWSPDGTRIVFERSRADEPGSDLFTVHLNSGDVSLLALWGWWPSWSPDGQRIVFGSTLSKSDKQTIETIEGSDTDESSREILYAIKSLQGFTIRNIDRPHWSPTGSHVAFYFFQHGSESFIDVYRMTDQGGDIVNLTPDIMARIRGWR